MAALILAVFVGLWFLFSFKVAVFCMIGLVVLVAAALVAAASEDTGQAPEARRRGRKKGPSHPINANLRITYEDANGAITTRDIRTISYSAGEIRAYCKLRRANRTFLTYRVKEAVDLDTGEIIDRLPTYFRAKRREAEAHDPS